VHLAGERAHAAVQEGARAATFGDDRLEARVLRGEPPAGTGLAGPAIIELPETTAVVPPGWRGGVDDHGTLVLERDR
jgi:N-methylhydantoinase A/oxoprolinase/acetone carboxylase beta subunit